MLCLLDTQQLYFGEVLDNINILVILQHCVSSGHPNVKAFITHGGLLSTTEAIHFGVPLIGIPAFGDQKTNLIASVNKGYAIKVDLQELDEENFYQAIYEVLHNPK